MVISKALSVARLICTPLHNHRLKGAAGSRNSGTESGSAREPSRLTGAAHGSQIGPCDGPIQLTYEKIFSKAYFRFVLREHHGMLVYAPAIRASCRIR